MSKISEDVSKNDGIIVMNANNVAIGFGVCARNSFELGLNNKSSNKGNSVDVGSIVVYHQADVGEYLR